MLMNTEIQRKEEKHKKLEFLIMMNDNSANKLLR